VILVVSFPEEEHSQDVIGRLRAQGRPVRLLDLGSFPARRTLSMEWSSDGAGHRAVVEGYPQADGHDEPLDLGDVGVVWWRRVRGFDVDPGVMAPGARAFAASETTQAVYGMLDALECEWVNPRAADDTAHHKPLQWAVAQRVGLRVPRTLVTNRPEDASAFVAQVGLGRVVFKAFLASLDAWRETRIVSAEDMARIDLVRLAPVIFQEYVDGVDLRITIVGERLFPCAIDARRTRYPFDMRMVVGEADVSPTDLPEDVRRGLLRLMRTLGLRYGAVDMRRTDAGAHVFLEVNPAGQWHFVEHRTGLPISEAVATELAALDEARAVPTAGSPRRRRARRSTRGAA
jgi:glutathione synthase/RimK-type ligase-like ATP-grasp enzyme